jgi:hypothetical protein
MIPFKKKNCFFELPEPLPSAMGLLEIQNLKDKVNFCNKLIRFFTQTRVSLIE